MQAIINKGRRVYDACMVGVGAIGLEAIIAAFLAGPITYGMRHLGYTTTYEETYIAVSIVMALQTWKDITKITMDVYENGLQL